MQKTERLLAISLLLQARGKMTARRLADILGVSTRTIYRDITSLSLAHIPVTMDYGPGGGYYLPDDYHFESMVFTREEAVSLVLSTDIAGNYSLFADDDGLHRALFKLEAALPEEYRSTVQTARERIIIDRTAWCDDAPPYLETLRSAVLEAHQLDILYPCLHPCLRGPLPQWRRIEPYGLVFKGVSRRHVRAGIWYLVAYCLNCQMFATFRVSLIEDVKVHSEPTTFRPDFDLQTYWQDERKQLAPYTLKLRVKPPTRYRLNGNVTQVKEKSDGSVVVRVEVESLDEAVSYVLALGPDATVIQPSQVRDAVVNAAQAIADMYDQLAT